MNLNNRCYRCGEPTAEEDRVQANDEFGQWVGVAHRKCEEAGRGA